MCRLWFPNSKTFGPLIDYLIVTVLFRPVPPFVPFVERNRVKREKRERNTVKTVEGEFPIIQ